MALPKIKTYNMPMAADIPENKVAWQADPERAVLLIHDMQQYFLNAYEPHAEPIPTLVRNIKTLKQQCTELGIPVVYTAQPGAQTIEDRALLCDFWGPGLEDDVTQTRIIDAVAPAAEDTVLTKWRYSAFKRSNLKEMMQEQGRDQLIICGIYAHIGCMLTASDAFMEDIQAFFVADAVADFSLDDHQMAINYTAKRCAVALTTEAILANIRPTITEQEIRQAIAEVIDEEPDQIQAHDDLLEFGMDSIRMMSLADNWRRQGIEITFIQLAEAPTIAAWSKLLQTDRQQVPTVSTKS